MECQNKVAIVTGAAGKGMGRNIALTLAREGAKVVVNYRTSEKSAKAIVEHIESRGGSAFAELPGGFVPGRDRFAWLDWAGFAMLAATLGAVSLHLVLRLGFALFYGGRRDG